MATQWNSTTPRSGVMTDAPSLIRLLRHAATEASEIVRSEANVIKLELEESTRAIIADALKVTLYSAVALLGLLSLLAFLIIGLADIITGHASSMTSFWASALIIGVIFTGLGGIMAAHHAKHLGRDTKFKTTRSEIAADKAFIKNEWNKL